MASENNDRTLPRHSTNAGVRRGSRNASRTSSLRLSIIEEDANYVSLPPTSPPKTHNRPFHRRFLGEPPRYSGRSPPTYTLWDVKGPKGEKFEDLRNNAYVARRGGWRRICVVAVILIACLVALVVGLAVGLHKKHSSSSATPAVPSSSSSPSAGPFPIGSYTFITFLDTTSTNCTSNPESWKCEPSVTYATSPTNSQATFNWLISAANSSSDPASNLTISSTDNPFSIDFSNATLTLVDAGTDNERYTFTTTVEKSVFPSFNVKCDYNDTLFTADLYTSKPKSYPSNSTGATSSAAGAAGGAFANWNYAVDATQSIGGGVDVPACYESNGDRVTSGYDVMPAADFCSCAYKNYDP
ncbi:hypothetical protein HO133_009380 [Letharia lupina]|uniref:Tat pathway signal sequence n=1 Tax=Letharia lupina TaxID=560253 RepID=A0A8H6CMZ5_9LECA|nr:uncharacterized protein HO133_009380 [Letharia lupina]KAF6226514.1 hypothetical protein HO133_009380 [Letharia lupina]